MISCLKRIISTTSTGSQAGDIGMLLLRVFAGLSMAFAHGWAKFPISQALIDGVAGMGFPMAGFFAHAAACSEVVGGLFLALGLLARPSAFFVAFTLCVAAFGVHSADPYHIKEMALLYLFVAVFFVLNGAGRFSLDAILHKKCRH